MGDFFIFQQIEGCIGCHACEVQCKLNKDIPPGPKPCEIVTAGPRWINGMPRAAYVFMSCLHCDDPVCQAVCPAGAICKRDRDGIVFIREDLCVGCGLCVSACPWGACQMNPETNRAVKCDLCMDRLDKGLRPLCVDICPTGCLHFGRFTETPSRTALQYSARVSFLLESFLGPEGTEENFSDE